MNPTIIYPDFLDYMFYNNSIRQYLFFISVLAITLIITIYTKYIVVSNLQKIVSRSKNKFDDILLNVLSSYGVPIYMYISFYFALKFLTLPSNLNFIIDRLYLIIIIYYVIITIQKIIIIAFQNVIEKQLLVDKEYDSSAINILKTIIIIFLWVIGILFFLQNVGFNISTILGGLGIGGIAIAFAMQNVLSDIFASISIFFDRPFKTGDFITIGLDSGTVQKIGLKSTRIKTLQGEILIVPNKELTTVRVQNFQELQTRRLEFILSLRYDTPNSKLFKVEKIIREIIESDSINTVNRIHFAKFSPYSLDFEVVYTVNDSNFIVYKDQQQRINFEIKKAFELNKIEFAYPTQHLYIEKK